MACYGDILFEPHGDQIRLYNTRTEDVEFVEPAEWMCRLRNLYNWIKDHRVDLEEADRHLLHVLCDCVQDMKLVLELVRADS